MITVLVQFDLPAWLTHDQAKRLFANIATTYFTIPGLLRKYFLLSKEENKLGGVYVWRSREAAEIYFNENFKRSIAETFGSEPSIVFFESPVMVDTVIGEAVSFIVPVR